MTVVADSSSLIALAAIDQLSLLNQLFETLVVPRAVADEVTMLNKPFARELQEFLANRILSVRNQFAVEALKNHLGLGEAETIALAAETADSVALIDDKKARRIAQTHGLNVIGTLAVLIRAKQAGSVSHVKPLIHQLQAAGIRINPRIIEIALESAGE